MEAATAALATTVDEASGVTLYRHKDSPGSLNSRSDISLYFSETEDVLSPLRLRIVYVADEWLLVERYILRAGDQVVVLEPATDELDRDRGEGKAWEWYDAEVGPRQLAMVSAALDAKEVTLRYVGRQTYERRLSEAEQQRLRQVLDAYKTMEEWL